MSLAVKIIVGLTALDSLLLLLWVWLQRKNHQTRMKIRAIDARLAEYQRQRENAWLS